MIYNRAVRIWLFIGLLMLFFQIIIGGITRITGSGLSITKWEIVTGTLPPLSDQEWNEAFELYKETPQYKMINLDMELGSVFRGGSFKFIYFWEYLHRLWARSMGFVFMFPFFFFLARGWIDISLIKRLGLVIGSAILAASFGWIMVASGLIERPWVNAYKLALHLCIGISVYAFMLITYCHGINFSTISSSVIHRYSKIFVMILILQLFFGGVMSGMKAGLFYPTWPDMNGEMIPLILFDWDQYSVHNFNFYDKNLLLPGLIQFIHRTLGYILGVLGIMFFLKMLKEQDEKIKFWSLIFIATLLLQIILGILTVINCKGEIPLIYGVLHQGMAVLLLSSCIVIWYRSKEGITK